MDSSESFVSSVGLDVVPNAKGNAAAVGDGLALVKILVGNGASYHREDHLGNVVLHLLGKSKDRLKSSFSVTGTADGLVALGSGGI